MTATTLAPEEVAQALGWESAGYFMLHQGSWHWRPPLDTTPSSVLRPVFAPPLGEKKKERSDAD